MKVLVLGDGLLGKEIIKQSGWNYISRKKDNIDFNNISSYKHFLSKYDTIVNCIANTNTYSLDKYSMETTNYKSVINLRNHLKYKKLIQISTDYVYAHSIEFASESDLPLISPNWYTYYKLLSDEYISNFNDNYLICRCSFKPNPFPYEYAWTDQIGNFDYVDKIASLIIQLIKINAQGILNVGTELKSIYTLANHTAHVIPSHKPENVPSNTSMNLDKLYNILKKNKLKFKKHE